MSIEYVDNTDQSAVILVDDSNPTRTETVPGPRNGPDQLAAIEAFFAP